MSKKLAQGKMDYKTAKRRLGNHANLDRTGLPEESSFLGILWLVKMGMTDLDIAYLGGLPFLNNGFVGETTFYGLLILVPPMYIAGGLLVDRTGLGSYSGTPKTAVWVCDGILIFILLSIKP